MSLGCNKTHIANNYSLPVYAVLTSEYKYLPEIEVENLSIKLKKGANLCDLLDAIFGARRGPQTIRVVPREVPYFKRKNATDYLSIFTEKDCKVTRLIDNLAIPCNRSYLVKENGQVVPSKYKTFLGEFLTGETSDVWIPED